MEDSSEAASGPSINPYRRDSAAGSQPGNRVACELCGNTRLCFRAYGLTACRTCHHELLPGSGVT